MRNFLCERACMCRSVFLQGFTFAVSHWSPVHWGVPCTNCLTCICYQHYQTGALEELSPSDSDFELEGTPTHSSLLQSKNFCLKILPESDSSTTSTSARNCRSLTTSNCLNKRVPRSDASKYCKTIDDTFKEISTELFTIANRLDGVYQCVIGVI